MMRGGAIPLPLHPQRQGFSKGGRKANCRKARRQSRYLLRVKRRNTRGEQMFSALPLPADIHQGGDGYVSFVPLTEVGHLHE